MLYLILLRDIPNQFVIFEDRTDTNKARCVIKISVWSIGGMVFTEITVKGLGSHFVMPSGEVLLTNYINEVDFLVN